MSLGDAVLGLVDAAGARLQVLDQPLADRGLKSCCSVVSLKSILLLLPGASRAPCDSRWNTSGRRGYAASE